MEYTVQRLSKMAGISTRTLRYYDEIGILKPARISSSGYRIYGQAEVDRLQMILFYRELGLNLESIRNIMNSPAFDTVGALRQHRSQLIEKRAQLDLLIANVDQTLAAQEGRFNMSDPEKFQGFKNRLIEDNEKNYGEEIRVKYGGDAVDQAHQKWKNMTVEQYEAMNRLDESIKEKLAAALATGDPAGTLAQEAADLHRQWLSYTWNQYSASAHAGVARMYVEDERFRAYYDADQPGTAAFLRDAISIYTGEKP